MSRCNQPAVCSASTPMASWRSAGRSRSRSQTSACGRCTGKWFGSDNDLIDGSPTGAAVTVRLGIPGEDESSKVHAFLPRGRAPRETHARKPTPSRSSIVKNHVFRSQRSS